MWSEKLPAVAEELRQGDLIEGVLLPKLELPLRIIGLPGESPGPQHEAVLKTAERRYIVLTQCCEIESGTYVALAPVKSTGRLTSDGAKPYLAIEPKDGEPYVYSAFRLEPVGSLREADGRLNVADLSQVAAYNRAKSELQAGRVARMSPHGRRLLRIKLGYFWSRAEPEDANALGDYSRSS
ncbi:MAG: hypothetical protein ACLQCU_11245 [Acidimicrobiales bacterium]